MKSHSQQKTVTKYYKALNQLYNEINSDENFVLYKFIRDHRLNSVLKTILTQNNIIVLQNDKYIWNSIKPTREMTLTVLDKINEYTSRHKSKNIKNESIYSQSSAKKYNRALNKIYIILSNTDTFNFYNFCKKEHISKNLSTALQRLEIVKIENKKWKWITKQPNEFMANKVIQKLSELNPPRKKPKKVKSIKIKKPKIKYYKILLFWGLLSIKVYPIKN